MPVNARFAKSALADLQAMQSLVQQTGRTGMGARLVEEIISPCVEPASQNTPTIGRVVPEFGQSFLREIIHPPFRIVYRRDSNAVDG